MFHSPLVVNGSRVTLAVDGIAVNQRSFFSYLGVNLGGSGKLGLVEYSAMRSRMLSGYRVEGVSWGTPFTAEYGYDGSQNVNFGNFDESLGTVNYSTVTPIYDNSWSVAASLISFSQHRQNREDSPGRQVDLAITGADQRLKGDCLREVTSLLKTAAERLIDNPNTRENEYTQRLDGNESVKDIYERDILTSANIINSLWNATTTIDAGNPNITSGSETDNSYSFVSAEAQGGTRLNVYGGFFKNIERGTRLPRPDANGLRYNYSLTGRTSNTDREITMLHEALHLVVTGFSDQLLWSIILNRNINDVARAQGSQAITDHLNRHCR